MNGGSAVNVKVFFDDKEVTALQTNTKLVYKMNTSGNVKIKFVGDLASSPIGSPYVENIDVEKGMEYHISIKAGSMFGVKGEVANRKKLKKINKNKFADTIELKED